MSTRIASAVVLLVIVVGAVVGGPLPFSIVVGAFVVVAATEYHMITRHLDAPAPRWLLMPLALLLLYRFQLPRQVVEAGVSGAIVLGLGAFLFQARPGQAMTRWALAVGGALYLGWSLGFYLAIFIARQPDPARIGFAMLAALAGSAFVGDTAAMLVGSRLGRHPFFSSVSPKKTVEGAVGGFVVQALFVAVFALLADIPFGHGLVLGALAAVASQGGDLVESQFKRSAGLKDASSLIPGHGGMLDRMDSLILVPIVAYYYLTLVLHLHLPG